MFYRYITLEQPGRILKAIAGLIIGMLTIQLAGCGSADMPTMDILAPVDIAQISLLEEYKIGVSDSLQISVWHNPDLSTQAVVLPDGNISVPLVGDVKAVGETTESLAEQITEALNNFIRQPEVTVAVLNAVSSEYLQRVRITGAVNIPLSLNYQRGMTVLDIVLLAGGLTPFANPNKALLYRKEDAELKVYAIRLEDILNKGKLDTNYDVLPSDIITVPEKSF